jgi:hypothetical protein
MWLTRAAPGETTAVLLLLIVALLAVLLAAAPLSAILLLLAVLLVAVLLKLVLLLMPVPLDSVPPVPPADAVSVAALTAADGGGDAVSVAAAATLVLLTFSHCMPSITAADLGLVSSSPAGKLAGLPIKVMLLALMKESVTTAGSRSVMTRSHSLGEYT